MIKLIAIGDIMGKAGRRCLTKLLPSAIEKHQADIVIANGENAAGGFGITKKIFDQLTGSLNIDCITTGNHWHDKREIYKFLPHQDNLIVPANMMNVSDIQDGFTILKTKTCGTPYAVVNLIGKVFMHQDNRNPFYAADEVFKRIPDSVRIRVVDMHAEATSEKQGLGRYLSGKASLVYGTHSHVPTADERILDNHTGYITDLGMTGAYDSVIGIRTEAALERMTTGNKKNFKPATDDPWMCFITASLCPKTGRCVELKRHRWELDTMAFS
jgi:metallophosphoesterase (TIGR00282 family)